MVMRQAFCSSTYRSLLWQNHVAQPSFCSLRQVSTRSIRKVQSNSPRESDSLQAEDGKTARNGAKGLTSRQRWRLRHEPGGLEAGAPRTVRSFIRGRTSKILRPSPPKPHSIYQYFKNDAGLPTLSYKDQCDDLLRRPPHLIQDDITPGNSHMLNVMLAGILPDHWLPQEFPESYELPARGRGTSLPMPSGHHLVYFPTRVPTTQLLPDGTDELQWPGEPFQSRLWVGGSLLFKNARKEHLNLDDRRAACLERVVEADLWGHKEIDQTNLRIVIERRYGRSTAAVQPVKRVKSEYEAVELERSIAGGLSREDSSSFGGAAIIESRIIQFHRRRTEEERLKYMQSMQERALRHPRKTPDDQVTVMPDESLLFRFSALTMNAHLVHLNREYCRDVEGHRNLLVQGQLTLVMMLALVNSRIDTRRDMIRSFSYRNLMPLYCDEAFTICVKRDETKHMYYKVWILNAFGGLAVTGSALVQQKRDLESDSRQLVEDPAWHLQNENLMTEKQSFAEASILKENRSSAIESPSRRLAMFSELLNVSDDDLDRLYLHSIQRVQEVSQPELAAKISQEAVVAPLRTKDIAGQPEKSEPQEAFAYKELQNNDRISAAKMTTFPTVGREVNERLINGTLAERRDILALIKSVKEHKRHARGQPPAAAQGQETPSPNVVRISSAAEDATHVPSTQTASGNWSKTALRKEVSAARHRELDEQVREDDEVLKLITTFREQSGIR